MLKNLTIIRVDNYLKILKEIRAIHKDCKSVASPLPDKDFAMKYITSDKAVLCLLN